MFSKNNTIFLLLDRSGFILFKDSLVNILKFNFTPDIIANLDVVNKDQLVVLITSFIEKNKISPGVLVVLLSDAVIYEKNLSPTSNQELAVQNFLANVPFEEVLAKAIKTEKLALLVAVNRDLVFSIIDPFIKKGFIVGAVVPSFLYGQNINITNGLTSDTIHAILRHPELMKSVNLLIGHQLIRELSSVSQNLSQNEKETGKKPKKRQFTLIGIFIVLLIVLGIVLFTSGILNSKDSTKTTQNLPTEEMKPSAITPTIVLSPTNSSSISAILIIEDIKITIVQNSQSETIAESLKEGLEKIGYKNIVSEVSEGATPAKTSLIFSKNIPTDIRQAVTLEINKILPNVLVLENEDLDSEIRILLGKS